MIHETRPIREEGSEPYARLTVYIQDYFDEIAVDKRPLVLICPGGAYAYTSHREAEPIALAFLAKGFHVAILRYSCAPARDPVARRELAHAVAMLRSQTGEWHIDTDRIVLWGASAGAHLAAHYACTWHDEMPELSGHTAKELAINGLMLAYPVITSGPHAHRGSIENLLGDRCNDEAELKRVSLENRVNAHVPRTFLWHTWTDESVPVENSLLFAQALKAHDINTELHIFPMGGHGLSLADWRTLGPQKREDEPCCQVWIDLATDWVSRL